MKTATIERIKRNAENGVDTVIGEYTYTANFWIGSIVRCKTADVGREWLDDLGRIRSGWEVVASLEY